MINEAAFPELEITSVTDPKSVVNLLPMVVSSYIKAIPEEVWLMDEDEIAMKGRCSEYDSLLRHAFWLEYDRAIRSGQKMNPISIYGGIVSKYSFFKEVCTNTFRLAYICTPPTDYLTRLDELLTQGLKQYREILMLPNVNAKGVVDSRLVAVKQKIIEDVANRRRGQTVQRLEVKSQNLNVNVDHNSGRKSQSVEEIQAEIDALEANRPALIPESVGGVSYAPQTSDEHEVIEVHAEETI